MIFDIPKFPMTKRGVLMTGRRDPVNTEVAPIQCFLSNVHQSIVIFIEPSRSFDKQADFFLVQPSHNYHWGIFSRVRCSSSSSWSKFMRKIASGFIYLVIIVFFLQVCSDLYDGSHMVNSLQLEHQARSSSCQKLAREINLCYASLYSLLVGKLVKQSDKN